MILVTVVNGVYKPTYNWGAPSCILYIYINIHKANKQDHDLGWAQEYSAQNDTNISYLANGREQRLMIPSQSGVLLLIQESSSSKLQIENTAMGTLRMCPGLNI